MFSMFLLIGYFSLVPPTTPALEPVTATVTTTDRATHIGVLLCWEARKSLKLRVAGKRVLELATDNVDSVRIAGRQPIAAGGKWELQTCDGAQLAVNVVGGGEEAPRFNHAILGDFELPWDRIRSLKRGKLGRLIGTSKEHESNADRILLRNGESLAGVISSADENSIRLLVSDEDSEEKIRWGSIEAVTPVNDVASTDATASPLFIFRLSDGAELPVKDFVLESGEMRLTNSSFGERTVSQDAVAAVECERPGRLWLCRKAPEYYDSIPFFSKKWRLEVDRNASGGGLAIGGVAYARGFGFHSACRATWRLEGRFHRLTALVGIDDAAGPIADADFLIRTGDTILYEANRLRHGEPARAIDVDVTGVKELTLEVRFGRDGDVQDLVDCANVLLE